MSDRLAPARLSTDAGLGTALRARPLVAPAASVWPELEAALRRQAPRRRSTWQCVLPYAAAAGLAGFALLGAWRLGHPPRAGRDTPVAVTQPAVANASADPAMAEIDGLRAQSQRIEAWLRSTARTTAPQASQDLLASAEIEDLIGLVDVQLSVAGGAESTALWRQRVDLLQDLAAIRATAYGLAFTDASLDGGAASPTWTN